MFVLQSTIQNYFGWRFKNVYGLRMD
ncbi:uncharacterized protein METZ01_LOCUS138432 [marine metagenome]|uniref:Uncharacterized protein n=1 Tax=marine metagenome TaxID=408172 RepID=A0A381Z8I6_9ZZZZ